MKVLFATDGSPTAMHALHEGARLLPLTTCEVSVVAVLDPEQRIGGNFDAAQDLVRAKDVLASLHVDAATVAAQGDPVEQIVATAERLGVDLLVIGANGRGALGRWMLGSVSEKVLRAWNGATLVIKPTS